MLEVPERENYDLKTHYGKYRLDGDKIRKWKIFRNVEARLKIEDTDMKRNTREWEKNTK